MSKALLLAISFLLLTATVAPAQEAISLSEDTSPNSPAQVVESCVPISWAAPPDLAVNHYHFYSGGILRANVVTPPYLHCIAEKRTIEEIFVRAIADSVEFLDTTLSNSLYVELVDRQCLEDIRVVPCP